MNQHARIITVAFAVLIATAFAGSALMSHSAEDRPTTDQSNQSQKEPATSANKTDGKKPKQQIATLGSGCFWCTEAMFQNLRGVKSAVSGYSGGKVPNPTYEAVCTGRTGHAEVVQVTFDPSVISYADLLRVFWRTHDPTTLNRQGADTGTQYRSVVFYHSDEQRQTAEEYKKQLDSSKAFNDPIVTEITKFEKFYPAEDYHQKYFELNPNQGYCAMVIRPKVEKFNKEFGDLVDKKAQ